MSQKKAKSFGTLGHKPADEPAEQPEKVYVSPRHSKSGKWDVRPIQSDEEKRGGADG